MEKILCTRNNAANLAPIVIVDCKMDICILEKMRQRELPCM